MFELMNKIDRDKMLGVAVSGGIDSVVLLHYLRRKFRQNFKSKNISIVHFNHCNDFAQDELYFVTQLASELKLPLLLGTPSRQRNKNESQEEYWRACRYEFFKSLNMQIATGHTLDDAVEWYLFTSFNGEGHLMPYEHANIIRPFLITEKEKIKKYAERNNIVWHEDATNSDENFAARNRIRNIILPEVLKINPGLGKVIKKKLLVKWRKQ